jgi:hypothetical protein
VNSQPANIKDEMIKLTRCEINSLGFSDSIVINIPLSDKYPESAKLLSIWACLASLCMHFLVNLAEGKPFRGGVDIGPCLAFPSKEVYGAALERAYYLESEIAEFPRVIVGDNLLEFTDAYINKKPMNPIENMTNKYARKIRNLVIEDDQKRCFLDFLGPEIIELNNKDDLPFNEVFNKMEHFVETCMQQYCTTNKKLFQRYVRLMEYIQFRKGPFLSKQDKNSDSSPP